MDLKLGVPVQAEDGAVGTVQRVILHPNTREVDAIVVVDQQILPSDIVVPIERIMSADENGVWLRGTVEEIGALEGFAMSQYVDPPEGWLPPTDSASSFYLFPASPYLVGALSPPASQPAPTEQQIETMPDGDIEVSGSTEVRCRDGVAGRIAHVVTVGDTDHVTHLVVRRSGLGVAKEIVVPVDRVVSLGDEGVVLDLSETELDELPLFSAAA